jgi:hypothetical protein
VRAERHNPPLEPFQNAPRTSGGGGHTSRGGLGRLNSAGYSAFLRRSPAAHDRPPFAGPPSVPRTSRDAAQSDLNVGPVALASKARPSVPGPGALARRRGHSFAFLAAEPRWTGGAAQGLTRPHFDLILPQSPFWTFLDAPQIPAPRSTSGFPQTRPTGFEPMTFGFVDRTGGPAGLRGARFQAVFARSRSAGIGRSLWGMLPQSLPQDRREPERSLPQDGLTAQSQSGNSGSGGPSP